jgi:hypothetical protein
VTHPEELASLDLYEVWTTAGELGDRFDPFSFEQRMAVYRLLLKSTNVDGLFGADNRHNPLWGLMFQHQWQFRTGRLGGRDGRIDPDAPWGYGNYALCVVPWLGAVAAGVVPSLPVVAPGPSRFRYSTSEFGAGVEDWRRFFLAVRDSVAGADREPLRLALWKAHKTCLDVVVRGLAGISAAPYSELEHTFLRGWCRMVDYLWVAAWPTDFDFMTSHGLDVLPETLLTTHESVRSLPPKTRRNVVNILRLARTPGWRYSLNLLLWKRIMRTREARDQVLPMLDAVFNPRRDNVADRRRMLRYLVLG